MSVYKIADLIIDIKNNEKYTDIVCKDYKASEYDKIDMTIVPNKEEIENDKKVLPDFSLGYIESLSIYRAISNNILDFDGFILHSSVVEKDGVAYAFSAKSGTGKTTHSKLWLEVFPDARIINGDKPLVRFLDGIPFIYGTPWCGKECFQVNTKAPLKALCFIERSDTNSITKISKKEAVSRIFSQLLLQNAPERLNKLLDHIDKLIEKVPVYLLKCNMDKEAAIVAYKGMNENG